MSFARRPRKKKQAKFRRAPLSSACWARGDADPNRNGGLPSVNARKKNTPKENGVLSEDEREPMPHPFRMMRTGFLGGGQRNRSQLPASGSFFSLICGQTGDNSAFNAL